MLMRHSKLTRYNPDRVNVSSWAAGHESDPSRRPNDVSFREERTYRSAGRLLTLASSRHEREYFAARYSALIVQ